MGRRCLGGPAGAGGGRGFWGDSGSGGDGVMVAAAKSLVCIPRRGAWLGGAGGGAWGGRRPLIGRGGGN